MWTIDTFFNRGGGWAPGFLHQWHMVGVVVVVVKGGTFTGRVIDTYLDHVDKTSLPATHVQSVACVLNKTQEAYPICTAGKVQEKKPLTAAAIWVR